jgi:hypothetical protein
VGIGINFIGRKIGNEIKKFVQLIFEARKDDNRNAILYNSAGEDSVPLNDERLILVKVDGTGKYIAVGVLTLSQGAKPGEKIYFSRDNKKLDESKIVAKISMLNDGLIKVDTDTETTDEAKGEYIRIIKGETKITERKDRAYLNEKNVNNTIKENETTTIEKDKSVTIKGNYKINVDGNYDLNVKGNINIVAAKNVVINGQRVDLN